MSEIVYSIDTDDIQNEAKIVLGRNLNQEELDKTIKLVQYGMGENMIVMYQYIFDEILRT
ncbi:MAG: hypothetical protein J5542_13360 [Bacteroidales bacterium]|nr:hypothetical protein [Bacteroidales bacterium]